jgi:hypothetical protein
MLRAESRKVDSAHSAQAGIKQCACDQRGLAGKVSILNDCSDGFTPRLENHYSSPWMGPVWTLAV